jgi:uncharacterized membrane protein
MLTRLRAVWQDINASYWFYPALFVAGSLALAMLTLWIDGRTPPGWLQEHLILRPANAESASTMLNAMAVSMMGVAATVFSITIAAVVYASGSYGPRLLNNFMEDRGNQLSLGTFMGTFVYAFTVLRAVRQSDGEAAAAAGSAVQQAYFVPQISLLTAYVLMGLAVAVLVYFLNHIPSSIRINSVLKDIGIRLLQGIDKTYPEPNSGVRILEHGKGVPVRAHGAGYIEVLDFARLHTVAKKHGGRIVMAVRTGDFVHSSVTIAYWCPGNGASDTEPPADTIRSCLALGSARTPHQDLQFLIDELVEIGLRALSPGINDPFTAITAIHWLGAATARLGERDLRLRLDREIKLDTALVIPLDDDYRHFVARGFGAIRSAVATNRIATMVMFDALADAATTLEDETRRTELRRQGDLLIEQARVHLQGPELQLAEARYVSFTTKFAPQGQHSE